MIGLAHSGAPWREPKSVGLHASRMVWAEVSPGVVELMTAAEALAYGGAAMEFVETVPGSGEYELTAVGSDSTLARLIAVKIGSAATITT